MTEEEILKGIKERKELIQTMVGTLYPSIVTDEIIELKEQLQKIKKEKDNV